MFTAVRSVFSLLFGAAIMIVGNGLMFILLPIRLGVEGVPAETSGLVMSCYYAGFVAGSLWGRDLIGRVGHIRAFAAFADRAERFANQPLRLLGTSGTVTTLASVFLELPRYDRRAVDGITVPAAAMRDISRRLAEASLDARAEIACIGRERADLVVAGCAILESIIDLWPAARVGVADRGIREGILRTLAMQGRDIPVTRREHRK